MDIFIIKTSDADKIKPELLEIFSHKVISNKKRNKQHCFSYFLLDKILDKIYGIKNREIEFIDKKPYLKSKEKFCSISHSKEYIVIAISESECGIDIEYMQDRNFASIAKRMNFNSKTLSDFYSDWTKYEAIYKLRNKENIVKHIDLKNYKICAVSSNIEESFEMHILNTIDFSNLKTLIN